MFLCCSEGKNTSKASEVFSIDCNTPHIANLIVRNDTIFHSNIDEGDVIKSYDEFGHLLKTDSTNSSRINSDRIFSYESIYDILGHLLYDAITQDSIKFHCYSYKYDKEGNRVEKQGYSSGELGIKITYVYKNGKLSKEIIEKPGSKYEVNH